MTPPGTDNQHLPFRSLPLAQREVALLIVLCVISAVTFAGTRRLAGWSRDRRAQAAAQWFARGEALAGASDPKGSMVALREAVAADRQNPHYALALATTLADEGQNDEARTLLLQLRQSEPDDVEINYRLARLAASSGDHDDAIRYYNYAMYGLARIAADRDRSAIRAELIAYLLDHGNRQEAVTELGALDRELPENSQSELAAANLADKAGEPKAAFAHYAKAAALDPRNAAAAGGAGNAAFETLDFAAAISYLERAIALDPSSSRFQTRAGIARLVLANDPLSAHVELKERARRLVAGLTRVAARADACLGAIKPGDAEPDPIRDEIGRLRRQPAVAFHDPDVLSHAVALIGAAEARLKARCPTSMDSVDEAWVLIAASHQSGGGA